MCRIASPVLALFMVTPVLRASSGVESATALDIPKYPPRYPEQTPQPLVWRGVHALFRPVWAPQSDGFVRSLEMTPKAATGCYGLMT
jgi:hypothetical protein